MIKFKMIKPFVYEMLIFLFVIAGIIIGLLTGNFVEISFHMHFITIAFLALCLGLFISVYTRVVNLGIKALFDFVFQSTKNDKFVFVKELPYRASIFSEKFGKNHERSFGMYYLIHAKRDHQIFTFISPFFIEMKEGTVCSIKSASSSHIILYVESESE